MPRTGLASSVITELNPEQRNAVTAPGGHQVVLAGAGSGKTRVLTHRIAWLIETGKASEESVWAMTFTTRAAREMHVRIAALLARPTTGLRIGTFHALGLHLLREHAEACGLRPGFRVLGAREQWAMVRAVHAALSLGSSRAALRESLEWINARKDTGQRAQISDGDSPSDRERVYEAYERRCRDTNAVDYGEMLLAPLELFERNPDVADTHRTRLSDLLIDEVQDTNTVQYRWIHCLRAGGARVFAVGDDDQTIYSWRGARAEHMATLIRTLKPVTLHKLECNYRSSPHILGAANAVIAKNRHRIGKKLWTPKREGRALEIASPRDADEEAQRCARQIARWRDPRRDGFASIGVLYRVNAQSLAIEEALREAGIRYQIRDAERFFDRVEIRIALAYLRLALSRDDDDAFRLALLNPPRAGLSEQTLLALTHRAERRALSLAATAGALLAEGAIPPTTATALKRFVATLDGLEAATRDAPIGVQVSAALEHSALETHYASLSGESAKTAVDNLRELAGAATRHGAVSDARGSAALRDWLELAESDQDGVERADRAPVHLMTIHGAKGLEFDAVWVIGCDEGVFPSANAYGDHAALEEERRLCYVAMTRAREALTLSYPRHRPERGAHAARSPARFLPDLPARHTRSSAAAARSAGTRTATPDRTPDAPALTEATTRVGTRVQHATLGRGRITGVAWPQVEIRFHSGRTRWMNALTTFLRRSA